MTERTRPQNIDEYIAGFAPDVQQILERIRLTIREVVPQAQEKISYQMPCFAQNGNIIYFAAFKKHIGIYPPVEGSAKLREKLLPYRGEKGNLKFPLDEPMPYDLIKEVVEARVKEHQESLASRK